MPDVSLGVSSVWPDLSLKDNSKKSFILIYLFDGSIYKYSHTLR